MLHSTFSKAVFGSHLLLLIFFPFISYQHPPNNAVDNTITAAATNPNKVQLNKHAVNFVRNYIQKNNEGLAKIKERSKSPFKTMEVVFAKYDLPPELKYLAVVESALKASAVSQVGAAGPWQLMPATAKILGLQVTATNDERKQYTKSTKAAAFYLRDLYSEFGDWLLVMAAYNCGPGPVHKAIRTAGSSNFWVLQAYLPAETREHVKKFIATHYYFEGHGSITTLTKAENIKHATILIEAMAKEKAVAAANRDACYKKQLAGKEQLIACGY